MLSNPPESKIPVVVKSHDNAGQGIPSINRYGLCRTDNEAEMFGIDTAYGRVMFTNDIG